MDLAGESDYVMALWGKTRTVVPKSFQHVLDLWQSTPQDSPPPNHYQCIALAYRATGAYGKATEFVEQARISINEVLDATEFSCWRYLSVNRRLFLKDLDEIAGLINHNHPSLPIFISDSIEETDRFVT